MVTRWSATLSSALDTSLVLPDLGARFASAVYTSSLGVGWDQMTTILMLPGGDRSNPRVPYDYAAEIYRTWRGNIGRVFLEGHLAWQGRVAEIYGHDVNPVDKSCVMELAWLGHAHDLEREPPELNASYSEEFATVSASALVRDLISKSISPIARTYANVQETAVNVGAIPVSPADTMLSLILNQLKGASAQGVEYTFLVWEPAQGPYLEPIGSGPARYRVRLDESPGAGFRWKLSELATEVRALFTNGDDNADATPVFVSPDGPSLNNGLHAYKAISVDAVNSEGATAARDAYAALHKDPSAPTDAFVVSDTISNLDGGRDLAGLVRANELVLVTDLFPFDALTTEAAKTKAIASTSYDVFSGKLSLKLDDRSILSRENEQMTELRIAQRLTEPLRAHAVTMDFSEIYDVPIPVPVNTPTLITANPIIIPALRAMRIHIRIALRIDDTATSNTDTYWDVGYSLDQDAWDYTDENTRGTVFMRNGTTGGETHLAAAPKAVRIGRGEHSLYVWARTTAGSYQVLNCKVFIDS